jgi:hypothetical protein
MAPAWQVLFAQQRSSGSPHCSHKPLIQIALLTVHVLPAQQL